MKYLKNLIKRTGLLITASVMVGVMVGSGLMFTKSASAAQLTSRKLELSSTANGSVTTGNPGSGSNGQKAAHTFTFTMGSSAATVGAVVIMYCDSPIPESGTCTTPTGMTAQNVASVAAQSGLTGSLSLDTATNNSSLPTSQGVCNGAGTTRVNCIALKMGSPQAQTGTPTASLKFGGGASDYITNPTTDNQTFYARIAVYSDTSYTTLVDYGSVASSTAQQIDITAKVQEKLNFSVGKTYTAPSTTCAAFSDDGALALGDSNGVLDSSTAYDAHSFFRVSTNATNGTVVKYSGDTLKSGTNSITALAAETLSTPGTEQFGLGIDTGTSEYSFTNLTAATGYDEATGNINPTIAAKFNYNTGSVTTPVTIASSSGIISCDTGDVRYVGNIATNTPAGIYTTTVTYLAVPTY